MTDARETIAKILREGAHEYDTTGEGPSDVEAADAILAALSRADLAQKPQWQPIETAPEDGTVVLGYCPYDDKYPNMSSIYPIRFNGRKYAEGWYSQTTDGDDDGVEPTHWMPLPDAPALVAHGEE